LNYGELKQRVTWFLDRTDLTTQISAWVNDARLQLANPVLPDKTLVEWPWLWTDSYLTTAAGSADYALPSDFLSHLQVLLEKSTGQKKKLHGYTQKGWDEQMLSSLSYLESNGEPSEYALIGQTLRLHPPPDAAYILRLYYYARPTAFSSDSQSDYMSNTYPYLIIHRTVLLGAVFLDDTAKIKMHAPLAQKELVDAVLREKDKKHQDVTHVMRTWKDFGKNSFVNRFQLRATPGRRSGVDRREVTD